MPTNKQTPPTISEEDIQANRRLLDSLPKSYWEPPTPRSAILRIKAKLEAKRQKRKAEAERGPLKNRLSV